MSLTARWILGTAALLFAAMFIPTIIDNPSDPIFWLVAIFIFLIAIACLIPRCRNISLRLICILNFLCNRFLKLPSN